MTTYSDIASQEERRLLDACKEKDAEIARLKSENATLKKDKYACGRGSGCCYAAAEIDLLKSALHWAVNCLEHYDNCYKSIVPPQFAAVIAEAMDQATKGPTNV